MATELEHILTSTYKVGMIAFMETHPECFEEAVKLAVSDVPLLSWRAAFLLWGCIRENDPKIKPHIKSIIKVLPEKNDGHQRELLKILSVMELNEKQEGFLFDLCLSIWEQINKNPSVRHTAFKFIIKIIKKHPELSSELNYLTKDEYMNSLSPGVRRSVFRIIKEADLEWEVSME